MVLKWKTYVVIIYLNFTKEKRQREYACHYDEEEKLLLPFSYIKWHNQTRSHHSIKIFADY